MSLTESQLKIFHKALNIEKERVEQFLDVYENNKIDSSTNYDLYDLMDEKFEIECKDIVKKLYRDGCTVKQLIHKLKEENVSFKKNNDEDLVDDAEVMSEDLFGIDHLAFAWTEKMIKEANKEEKALNKSQKLRTWEHSYKSAVQMGVPIQELDESIKSHIARYLREYKGSLKKKRTRAKQRGKAKAKDNEKKEKKNKKDQLGNNYLF